MKQYKRKDYSEFFNAVTEFRKQLHELKKKSMKITDETKIKDLIPEGYEVDNSKGYLFRIEEIKGNLCIPIKEKEVKDFIWYVDKYFGVKFYELPSGEKVVTRVSDDQNRRCILNNIYDSASFESKIGLLKFICDDVYPDKRFADMVYSIDGWLRSPTSEYLLGRIVSFCPKEFLDSIFK